MQVKVENKPWKVEVLDDTGVFLALRLLAVFE